MFQTKSYDYAREMDTKHPDFRRIIGRIVDNKMLPVDGQKVLPCGPFNKNDSCPYAGLSNVCHPGPVGVRFVEIYNTDFMSNANVSILF